MYRSLSLGIVSRTQATCKKVNAFQKQNRYDLDMTKHDHLNNKLYLNMQ